jgi:hypothetical protein
MCLWIRATVLTNSIFPPAAGLVRAADIEDGFLDQRLAAMSVRNSTSVFQEEAGMQSSWPRPQPAGEPKLALAQAENVLS